MARRRTRNLTEIPRIEGIPFHDAWVMYTCLRCQSVNFERIGNELLTPSQALEQCVWICGNCGFVHSKESELPFGNWPQEVTEGESLTTERFWQGFFRTYTEHPESYWKQCNACGRILPFNAFSRHSRWGPLEKQMECRACKGVINAVLNPRRTAQQMHEGSVTRRVADAFIAEDEVAIDIVELFERFDGRCFKTGEVLDINNREPWAIDHILPSKYMYPLTVANAALLSRDANATKRDNWPSRFYTNDELVRLARITGANLELLTSPEPIVNRDVDVNRGVERYLAVRQGTDLRRRIAELKRVLQRYRLVDGLTDENKTLLGFA